MVGSISLFWWCTKNRCRRLTKTSWKLEIFTIKVYTGRAQRSSLSSVLSTLPSFFQDDYLRSSQGARPTIDTCQTVILSICLPPRVLFCCPKKNLNFSEKNTCGALWWKIIIISHTHARAQMFFPSIFCGALRSGCLTMIRKSVYTRSCIGEFCSYILTVWIYWVCLYLQNERWYRGWKLIGKNFSFARLCRSREA